MDLKALLLPDAHIFLVSFCEQAAHFFRFSCFKQSLHFWRFFCVLLEKRELPATAKLIHPIIPFMHEKKQFVHTQQQVHLILQWTWLCATIFCCQSARPVSSSFPTCEKFSALKPTWRSIIIISYLEKLWFVEERNVSRKISVDRLVTRFFVRLHTVLNYDSGMFNQVQLQGS